MKLEVFSALDKTHVPGTGSLNSTLNISSTSKTMETMESQGILGWKGCTRVIKSNSSPCTGYPKNPTLCLRAILKMEVIDHGLKKKDLAKSSSL